MQVSRHGFACVKSLKRCYRRDLLPRRHVHVQGQDDVLQDLRARGLVADIIRPEELQDEIARSKQAIYAGVDPTASSLHVGHLLPLICLLHFRLRGHRIIPLIGGATGLIGDPSGRSTERPLSEQAKVAENVTQLTLGVRNFFSQAALYARKRLQNSHTTELPEPDIRNNLHWFQNIGLLEFLRTVGIHSRVNTMLNRESVQARLTSQQGISFTEFTYQLLQGYDFYRLHKDAGVTIQLGGSDQWGNIIAGIDLIDRLNATSGDTGPDVKKCFGITTPLLTTASGEKFGKSAGNAVSLNDQITGVFEFYQFFMRTNDADVGKYLKMFTLLTVPEIDRVLAEHAQRPEVRNAQRLLADEVTELVHGESGLLKAQTATKVLFGTDFSKARASDITDALRGNPFLHFHDKSEVFDVPITKLAVKLNLTASNSAARQLVASKGLYLNGRPVTDPHQTLSDEDFLDGKLVVLRAGTKKQAVLALN